MVIGYGDVVPKITRKIRLRHFTKQGQDMENIYNYTQNIGLVRPVTIPWKP